MVHLRERGVYRLPDGQEVIALRGLRSGHFLYSPEALADYKLPEYEMNSAGELLRDGEATGWGINDLADMGRSLGEMERADPATFVAFVDLLIIRSPPSRG